MTAPRERVRALVALATGATTPVEEARTAAMAAARLISEHDLLAPVRVHVPGGATWDAAPSNRPGAPVRERAKAKAAESAWDKRQREAWGEWAQRFADDLSKEPVRARSQERPQAQERRPEPPDPFERLWEEFDSTEAREKKRYRDGWDRIWGAK